MEKSTDCSEGDRKINNNSPTEFSKVDRKVNNNSPTACSEGYRKVNNCCYRWNYFHVELRENQ